MKRLATLFLVIALAIGASAHAQDSVLINTYGALSSSADSKAAIQKAIDTGKTVRCVPGTTYLTDGGITSSTVAQVIDFTGCTIKLKNSAGTKGILIVTGARARVVGGTWDMNKANNATGSQYGHYAVSVGAEGNVVEGLYVKDSHGIGIKGVTGANNIIIRGNRVEGFKIHGIYVESTTADAVGNKILNNFADGASMEDTAVAIYLVGKSDNSFLQRRWEVSGNVVKGHTNGAITTVGITVRGYEGVYQGNQVTGTLIQHSVDYSQRSTISGNRGSDPAIGGTTYCLEINSSYNTISGNYCKGHSYGLATTGQNADGNTITGNVFEAITSRAIYFNPSGGNAALNNVITGNTISFSVGTSRVGIYLQGNCTGALIQGNRIVGPGSGQAGGRAVYLADPQAAARLSVIGNKVSGFERAWGVTAGSPTTVTDLADFANDLSYDVGQSDSGWLAEGSVTFGARIQHAWGFDSNGGTMQVIDKTANIYLFWSDAINNPEGVLTAGIGSLYVSKNSAGGAWVKNSGTGNTGWRPIRGYDFDGSTTYDPANLADGAGATTTVTVTGAALGDFAEASFSLNLQGITVTAWVSAADTVSVRFQNESGGPLDLGSGTLKARVKKS